MKPFIVCIDLKKAKIYNIVLNKTQNKSGNHGFYKYQMYHPLRESLHRIGKPYLDNNTN